MSCGSLRTVLRFTMTIPQRNAKRPANTQLAGSAHWYDLPTATLQAWLDEWRITHPKHTPAIERVKRGVRLLVFTATMARRVTRPHYSRNRATNSQRLSISLGSVCDVIAFLDWLGVLPTLRAGGQGVATTRQLLRPEFSLQRDNPVPKETERNGIQAEHNGETHRSQRALPHYSKSPSDQAPTPPPTRAGAVVKKQQVHATPARSMSAGTCRECNNTGKVERHSQNGWVPNPCPRGCEVPVETFSEQELETAMKAALEQARKLGDRA
jgi:hypothetical protein